MSAKSSKRKREQARPLQVVEVSTTTFPLEVAARLAELSPQVVRSYWELGLVTAVNPSPKKHPLFDDNTVYQLRRIEHFRVQYRVNEEALPLVVALLRDLERLQAELRFFQSR